jgi:hypothetical protein
MTAVIAGFCISLWQSAHDICFYIRVKSGGDHGRWCCQADANQSLVGQSTCPLFRAETAPLDKSGGTVQLENGAGVKVALQIGMVVNRGMDGGEFM